MATKKKAKAKEVEEEVQASDAQESEEMEATSLSVADRIKEETGFDCVDSDKLERVIFGEMGRGGLLEGGIGDADVNLVLAHYDKKAGLILKGGVKVKTGSFWDSDRRVRAPRKEPMVKYLFNVGGETVEVNDPSELAGAVLKLNDALAKKEAVAREKKAAAAAKRRKPLSV